MNKTSFGIAFKFVFKLCSYAKLLTIFMTFLLLCNTLLMYIVPILSQRIIDDILNFNKEEFNYILMIVYVFAIIVSAIFSNLERYISIKQSENVNNRYRSHLLRLIMKKNYVNYNKYSYGDIETIMTSCIEDIDDSTYCFIETILIYPIGLIIGITCLLNISYSLIILILLQLIINYIIMSKGSISQEKESKKNLKCQARYFSFLSNLYNAYENVRLMFISEKSAKKHDIESSYFADSNSKMAKVSFISISMALSVTEAIFNITTILIFYILIKNGTNTVGGYIAYIAIKEAITGDITGFIKLKVNKKKFDVALEQINEIVPIEEYLNDTTDEQLCSKLDNITSIRFNELNFTYPDSKISYKLNYEFRKDNCYLILGENGAGKSTMIRLLAGLLPSSEMYFNNINNNLCEDLKKNKISILPQNIRIFDDSIIDLIIDKNTVFNNEIIENLKVSNIISDIQNNPDKKNSALSSLSGGEKKKVLLSLILSSNFDVIILDEPFAELDNDSKKILAENINLYSENRIMIIVTHEIPKELEDKKIKIVNLNVCDKIVSFSNHYM